MRFLFYFGHPAHFHMFKHVIAELKNEHEVILLCKKKDMLDALLQQSQWDYTNIQPEGRKDGKSAMALGLLKRNVRMFQICRKHRPDVLIGSAPEIGHVGQLLRIPSIAATEDDVDVIKVMAHVALPFASVVLTPITCNLGKWEHKTRKYQGYQKLAYLHPNQFKPERSRVESLYAGRDRYYLLRLVKLNAHHDFGITGISDQIAQRVVGMLEQSGKVWISAERPLPPELEQHRLSLRPEDIHHALAFADLFIGDSQSMTVESALLGTPAVRVSDFAGRIGVLEELEHDYGLTIAIRPNDDTKLMRTIKSLLDEPDLKAEWQRRRKKLLDDKIDVTAYFSWFIKNYPQSARIVRDDPAYPVRFK